MSDATYPKRNKNHKNSYKVNQSGSTPRHEICSQNRQGPLKKKKMVIDSLEGVG